MGNGSNTTISKLQEHHFGTYVCDASNMVNGIQKRRFFGIVLFEETSNVSGESYNVHVYMYICVCTYMCVCVCVCIYYTLV